MSNEKQQTAVDRLELLLISNPKTKEDFEHNKNCFVIAKKMQKNQMIAFAEESINYLNNKDCRLLTHFDRIEEYYNLKYGK